MSWVSGLNASSLYVEIRQRSLRVLYGEENLLIPIERQPAGRLTPASKQEASLALRALLKKKNWQPRARAFCAIEARGISLRRLSLPASANGDLQRVLRLQLESEFPLPPEALAWGYSRIEAGSAGRSGMPESARTKANPGTTSSPQLNGNNDFMVAALKKEVLEDYSKMFTDAGVTPVFTVAALARKHACPQGATSYAVLDIGRNQSEFISFAGSTAESLRVLPWGGDSITRAIEQKLGVSLDEAEKLKLQSGRDPAPNGEVGAKIHDAFCEALSSLVSVLPSDWSGGRLYLTGRGSRYGEFPRRMAALLPNIVSCEYVEAAKTDGPTAAILGLKKSIESENAPLVVLRLRESTSGDLRDSSIQGPFNLVRTARSELREIAAQPVLRKWARLAILLAICLVCFPYAQAFLLKPFLAKKLTAIRAQKGRLATIDRELTFLQYLKNAQPPYLDALTVLANAAPPGTRFESVSLNRRGEMALKGNIGNAQQVVDFRTKLIKSAFFSTVTIEEQTPSPDRQRMTVRILAQCKPAGARPTVKVEPLPPGFTPGGSGMPFPGMMGGGPVVFSPGAMPSPMIPGAPPGVIMRGPEGAPGGVRPGPRASFQSRYGLNGESAVNPADAPKPVVVEEVKKPE